MAGSILRYIAATGDKYTGFDTFGQIVDQRWVTASGSDQDRFKYGYDLAGNPLWKQNTLSAGHSELYHDAATSGYDALGRLTNFFRGTLTFTGDVATGISGTPLATQSWNLDSLGNWSSSTLNGTNSARAHDAQNRLTGLPHERWARRGD